MASIALTGATGFVGRQILRFLAERGHNVRLIVRVGKGRALDVGASTVELVNTTDLFAESIERLCDMLEGIDTLIHAAWYAEPGKYLTSPLNVDCLNGSIRLAQAFQMSGGRRFVGVGSCAEYDLDAGVLKTVTPLRPGTLYAACKASAYLVLSHLLPSEKIEFVWCRLFYLFGEGEDPRRLVPYLHQQLSAGVPVELTSGNQIRDFLDVRVAGAMIAETAIGNYQGPINICSGVPVTVRQLAERIADEYGRRDLLRFGVRPDNLFDPPCVVGVPESIRP
jgi:dTDP-6-deoxy-L-talose 4-dehydrogenase (NAD+)